MFKFGENVKKVEKAVKKSAEAVTVFTNVINQLKEANQQLASSRQQDIEQIKIIEENVQNAYKQEQENEKLIGKINSIIGG